MDNLALLRKTVLFKDCTNEELELVLGLFQERHVKPNTIIFTEKMAAEAIYIIKNGAVRISLTSLEGEDVQLLFLGPGDFFGELALLQEENRLVNARTITQSDLLYLSRKDFQALIDLEPRVGSRVLLAIAKLLAMRVNAYRDKLREMLLS
jgi:CRP-like cAMP-binding protein